jgi:tRNA (guanine-N7-)-methyltransferase
VIVLMRMRKKPNMPQRMERCAAVHITEPETYRESWLEKFQGYKSLHLEIGCGRGRFTAETALSAPDTLLVAVERVPEALIIGMERAVREEIPNVRFINGDAASLPLWFGAGEIDRIYLNFCDPWPGSRHAKRRLTHESFLRIYRALLSPCGEIHFKTDNQPLFEFSLHEFAFCGFAVSDVTYDLHNSGFEENVMTEYERHFSGEGVPICRCVAKLEVRD